MKKIVKGIEPPILLKCRIRNPAYNWKQFKKYSKLYSVISRSYDNPVTDQLNRDQGGVCAYCEINLIEKDSSGDADFRVEHFHPKSDTSTQHNWHLDWNNLLGCCHGGSQRNVVDAGHRFTSPDNSCDVPKGNKNLDSIILSPLQLPAFPNLFGCARATGILVVNTTNCQIANVSEVRAGNTISELKLDAPRLNKFRKQVLDKLNDDLSNLVKQGLSIGQARMRLAQVYLCKNAKMQWPAFFTSIRCYLGAEAEEHLRNIGFNG